VSEPGWPGWRGANRDGVAPWLPDKLPERPKFVWRHRLAAQALAGVAADERYVLVADRDPLDTQDIFRCLRADTGEELWALRNLATGKLDYGNSPRATPLLHGDLVFLYNAFGRIWCVRLATGGVVWQKDLPVEFGGRDEANAWGTTSSPLIVDGKLIVNPGGPQASLVALKPETGEVIWKTPGDQAAFSSLIVGTFGTRRQIVGYERRALCGWDIDTGRRLWRVVPKRPNDFNVPTPLAVGGKLLVSTEHNGTRLYRFTDDGMIVPEPVASNRELAPDSHTPVAISGRLFGVWSGLRCLDAATLKPLWTADDDAFNNYATAIAGATSAGGNRVLVVSKHGELLLIDAAADTYRLLSRQMIFDDDSGVLSHPALVGQKLYLRGSDEIVCLDLAPSR
jgi:outer membrane protein assembly factor BamB